MSGNVETRAIRVLIAEDLHMIRGALVALLSSEPDMEVVAELERVDQVAGAALETQPDVAVLDIDLPGLEGLEATESLAHTVPACRVLILTGLGQPNYLLRALQAGARGFLLKDAPADSLADAIRRLSRGEHVLAPSLMTATLAAGSNPLTSRESDVFRLANLGLTTEEIGSKLVLSPATVRNYMSSGISKVGGRNRIDAIRIASEAGWL
ncbi:response regulator transcription factor [Phytoactinopolyspora halotolerans]|uniref:Response regulator transcription factor n=1 Tax=Phytoactinopolyspora halotolerans TaxID=1981512 RepID=A0A6L9S3I9_9ACTN|nr:response regulator transcription factor [Phytoactinopolyspora halotolerans]NED99151.1 response regulator transcription factor [Phytoactinopolyspora halotolerans]